MFSTVLSAALHGMDVEMIHVEADISNGLPMFHMIGYLASEVKEAGDRVKTAVRNLGYQIPPKKVVINMSPASVRKTGTKFDLPIAVAILTALGLWKQTDIERALFIGELGLDGSVQNVSGILPIVLEAKKQGCTTCFLPKENAKEGALVEDIDIIGISHLSEIVAFFRQGGMVKEASVLLKDFVKTSDQYELDYTDIQGQDAAKRAVEVAVAGQHHLLLVGPPGAGKSMIAKRIPTILPPLSKEECLEISKIYSIVGELGDEQPYISARPFRNVHQSITKAGLIGGGQYPRPGELSMASGGVLFLDELTEFRKDVLELLRIPLEEHEVRIIRNRGIYTFPANTMVVGAMNPCPCGYYPDYNRCSCSESEITKYLGRISGPFLDRLDICIEVPRLEYATLTSYHKVESSKDIRERVMDARMVQENRYQFSGIKTNAQLNMNEINTYCTLDMEGQRFMSKAFTKLHLTARTYHKILRVARTIADLEHEAIIRVPHLSEAISYRTMNRKYWG